MPGPHLLGFPPWLMVRSHFSSASFSIFPNTAPNWGLEKTVTNTCTAGMVPTHPSASAAVRAARLHIKMGAQSHPELIALRESSGRFEQLFASASTDTAQRMDLRFQLADRLAEQAQLNFSMSQSSWRVGLLSPKE